MQRPVGGDGPGDDVARENMLSEGVSTIRNCHRLAPAWAEAREEGRTGSGVSRRERPSGSPQGCAGDGVSGRGMMTSTELLTR